MTDRMKVAAWAIGLGAAFVLFGFATFDQWAALVMGLLK